MERNVRTNQGEQSRRDAMIDGAIRVIVVKRGGEGSIQGGMIKKKGLSNLPNPLYLLEPMRGFEPRTY
jgi:hypothetical protein